MLKLSRPMILPFISGSIMTLNFVLFWAVPIAGMGQLWKLGLSKVLMPVYEALDNNRYLRTFAEKYVYTKPLHSDFFATSLLVILNSVIGLGIVFYWQLSYGSLPWWLVFLYYCSWVGVGGRIMGSAYTLAHREGHNQSFYQRSLKYYIGNFFENNLGCFFGNIPWNFSTSHVFIHHKLDGGMGDTFYEWDLDRSNFSHFMLYVHRIFLHMVGYSSMKFFYAQNMPSKADLLWQGIVKYVLVGLTVLLVTRSLHFVFWIYVQPLLCMSYFLALINIGFHGFIEFDENGESIHSVNSTTIIDGTDDSFGEDDHMAHHYNINVYYRDLPQHQASMKEEYLKHHSSVFRALSIAEVSIFIIFGLWDKLADHYVDYSGKLTKKEIMDMLKRRATTRECTYEYYESYLSNPTLEARKGLKIDLKKE